MRKGETEVEQTYIMGKKGKKYMLYERKIIYSYLCTNTYLILLPPRRSNPSSSLMAFCKFNFLRLAGTNTKTRPFSTLYINFTNIETFPTFL